MKYVVSFRLQELRQATLISMLAALIASSGYVVNGPAALGRPLHATSSSQCPNWRHVQMVSAQEIFGQVYEASPPASKTLSSLPPPVAKSAGAAVLGLTYVAGFALTPSRRIPVNAIGGGLTALVGNLGRKRIENERQKAALPALASVLSQGLGNVTPENLEAIMAEYDVPKKQFESQLGELYLTYLSACLTSHLVDVKGELSELQRLQKLLKLSAAATGNQVYAAARQLYSRHRAYLEEDDANDSKRLLEKFVFLAERILSQDESPEGYRYEVLRLQKLFSLTAVDWRAMAENAAVPFYNKALGSAVLEGMAATPAQLASMRAGLGVTDGCAEGMHAEVYSQLAGQLLAAGSLSAADQERLTSTRDLLGMADDVAGRNLGALTAPLYTSTVNEVLEQIAGATANLDAAASAAASGKLAVRMQELMLDASSASGVETAAMRTKGQGLLEEAIVLIRAQNIAAATTSVKGLLGYCERAAQFMADIQRTEGDALSTVFAGLNGSLKGPEIIALYRVLLTDYLGDMKVDDAEKASLGRLSTILGLSESDEASVYQAAAGPLYRQAVAKAVGGEGGAPASGSKEELQQTIANLALPEYVTSQISTEVYTERLKSYSADGKIVTEEEAATLSTLRDFLGIAMEDVYSVHEKLCSDAYVKSVREVMGTSGIIPDEYWEGLTKLQTRMGISDDAAQMLFAKEVKSKMQVFGDTAVKALEEKAKKQQAAQEGNEQGKMEMEAETELTKEINSLVEFAVASKALATKEVDGEEIEVIGASLAGDYEKATLKELYRQYLVEAFSGGNAAQNEKVFGNLSRLALVLGLEAREVSEIHNQIGSLIYRQYISKALQKGPLGSQETTFLASIKDALGMEQDKCDELIRDCQIQRVSLMIEKMFEMPQVLAADSREMRDAADTYDVDLVGDLKINSFRLERLFLCELEELVDSGELQPDNLGILEELCEPLYISEEKAAKMLEEIVGKRTSGGMLQAAADMRQGQGDRACDEITRFLKFAALLDGTVAEQKQVAERERNELFMLYSASLANKGGGDATDDKAKLELLRQVMGMAPVEA